MNHPPVIRLSFVCAILTLLLVFASGPAWCQIFVDSAAAGLNDGTSWTDAHTDLQDALAAATNGDEIWVAAGAYKPTATTDRSATFQLLNGVAIYGGFAGTESLLSERDLAANPTILSGDIGTPADITDNCYHVVTGGGTDATAVIDGFAITEGNADGTSPDNLGGGMYCEVGSPTVVNSVFENNTANNGGGLFARDGANPTLVNVVFTKNTAVWGGAISTITNSNVTLTNVTIIGNTATAAGGGISNVNSVPIITNSIVYGNTAPTEPQIRSPFSANPIISHSLVEGSGGRGEAWDTSIGADGGNNIDVAPMFVDLAGGDFRLTLASACANGGDNGAPGLASIDLDGNPRIFGGTVDMGAYELEISCPPGPVVYVDDDALGANDGSSWMDAFTELSDAMGAARICSSVSAIWVAAGTYTPTMGVERDATFQLIDGVVIYGGFDGSETLVSQRDLVVNTTTLSGDIGAGIDPADNSYHVVTGGGNDATAVLDGFTITDGNADGSDAHNLGGGMYIEAGSPTVINIVCTGNTANNGGGMFARGGASPTLVNVVFTSNTAVWGGAISTITSANAVLTNVTITDNTATNSGGGISNVNSTPMITNSILFGNTAPSGPDVHNPGSAVPVFSYSLVRGSGGSGVGWLPSYGADGGNNIDETPNFADEPGGDLRLTLASPCVNGGDNAASSIATIDLDGNARIFGGTVDMGAYELYFTCPPGPVVFVDRDALGAADGSSWTDAFKEARDALGAAKICVGIDEVWVAEGTYKPTSGADQGASFRLQDELGIYGGFNGTETLRDDRDAAANITTLSGDVGTGDNVDDSHHVVTADGVDSTAVLDGFTIQRSHDGDKGGGILVVGGNPTLSNLSLDLHSAIDGAGLYNDGGRLTLTNIRFFGNFAGAGGSGGGMYTRGGSVVLVNSIFLINGGYEGGGLYCESGNVDIVNSTFNCNDATFAVALFNEGATVNITNTIMWDDRTIPGVDPQIENGVGATTVIAHSLIESSGGSGGGWNSAYGIDGGNNIDIYPFFVDDCADVRLVVGSHAIDSGDNGALYLPATDFDGNPRITDGIVDMGAFESQNTCLAGSRFYVDKNAAGAGNGTSWNDAFTELRDAIAAACGSVEEIWVAAGTYKPTAGVDREATFRMRPGLNLHGGFAGSETDIGQADPEANLTILSGDIGVVGNPADNSMHVVDASYTSPGDVLSGFTITGGQATDSGAGLYGWRGNVTVRKVNFVDNHAVVFGGGAFNLDGDPVFFEVSFVNCSANSGGGLSLIRSDARITNAVISDNSADDGGGLYVNDCNPIVVNALFDNNSAVVGGAVRNAGASPVLTNVTFTRNSASVSGVVLFNGLAGSTSNPSLTNCIMWGNVGTPLVHNQNSDATFFYCIVEGAYSGGSWDTDLGTDNGGNHDVDPLFINPAAGNFRLQPASPAINDGFNSAAYLPPYDLDGNSRIIAGTIDMGPYEYVTGTGIDDTTPGITGTPGIKGAYPNPFNPTVTVAYENDLRQEIHITIYDIQGRRVRELFRGMKTIGAHRITWDATDSGGTRVASGLYFVEVKSDAWRDNRKVILLK